MPKLEIPTGQRKVQVAPPSQIPYPGQLAGLSAQLGQRLANFGKQFLETILQSRTASEMSKAERDIEASYFETLRGLETEKEPLNYEAAFTKFDTEAKARIAQIKIPGARANIQNWYNKNVSQYQANVFALGLDKEQTIQLEDFVIGFEKNIITPIIPKGDQNIDDVIKDKISDLELSISNTLKTNPKMTVSMAQQYIQRAHIEVPMKTILAAIINFGPDAGLKWFEEQKKTKGTFVNKLPADKQRAILTEASNYFATQDKLGQIYYDRVERELIPTFLKYKKESDFPGLKLEIDNSELSPEDKLSWLNWANKEERAFQLGAEIIENPIELIKLQEMGHLIFLGTITYDAAIKQAKEALKVRKISDQSFLTITSNWANARSRHQAEAEQWIYQKAQNDIISTGNEAAWEQLIQTLVDPEMKLGLVTLRKAELKKFNNFIEAFEAARAENPEWTRTEMQEWYNASISPSSSVESTGEEVIQLEDVFELQKGNPLSWKELGPAVGLPLQENPVYLPKMKSPYLFQIPGAGQYTYDLGYGAELPKREKREYNSFEAMKILVEKYRGGKQGFIDVSAEKINKEYKQVRQLLSRLTESQAFTILELIEYDVPEETILQTYDKYIIVHLTRGTAPIDRRVWELNKGMLEKEGWKIVSKEVKK